MHMHDFGRFGLIVGVVLCLDDRNGTRWWYSTWFKIGSGGSKGLVGFIGAWLWLGTLSNILYAFDE